MTPQTLMNGLRQPLHALAAGDFAIGQPVPIFPRLELPEGEGPEDGQA